MSLTKSRIFLIASLSFIAGVFWASFFGVGIVFALALVVLGIIFFVLGYGSRIGWVAILVSFLFSLGVWRVNDRLGELERMNEGGHSFSARMMVEKTEEKDKYKNVIAKLSEDDDLRIGKILFRADLFEELDYGDEIDLDCILEVPKNFSDDFDYKMYLFKSGIHYVCQKPHFEKTGRNIGNAFYTLMLKEKKVAEQKLTREIPAPGSALATGILFGGDDGLSKGLQEKFSKTGMTHIVAVSGYNVTIIAEYLIMLGIFLGLWRKQAFYFAVFGILLFVAVIGLPSSAIRAGIMGTLLLWAMKNGRLANSYNAIVFAGALMILANPLLLRWDIGFQLSFLAALGIIATGSLWDDFFIKKIRLLGLGEIICLTVSAQIFVLPIIFLNFKTFSTVSLLANILILPIIPITMLFSFLTVVFGFVFAPFATIFAWVAHIFLKYEVWVVEYLSGFSWSSKQVNGFGGWSVFVWYVVLVFAVVALNRRKRRMEM